MKVKQWWNHLVYADIITFFARKTCQKTIRNIEKSLFEGEYLHIFWEISIKFRVKSWLIKKLKVTKTRVSLSLSLSLSLSASLSLENTFLKKTTRLKSIESWDCINYGQAMEESNASQFFALSRNLLLHCNCF